MQRLMGGLYCVLILLVSDWNYLADSEKTYLDGQ